MPPSTRLLNHLLTAHKRSHNPREAEDVLLERMPALGVEADVVSWNAVIGAWAQSGNVDATFRLWDLMRAAGFIGDEFTKMHLALACKDNVALGVAVVEEIATATAATAKGKTSSSKQQDRSTEPKEASVRPLGSYLPAASQSYERWDLSQGKNVADRQMDAPGTELDRHLDLHHMSVPSARVAILQWLAYIGGKLQQPDSSFSRQKNFGIITGHGSRSKASAGGVLTDVAKELCSRLQLPYQERRLGMLTITAADMTAWVQRKAVSEKDRLFTEHLRKLCLCVGGTIMTAFGAICIVPELLSYS